METFANRLADKTKTPLHANFITFIKETAALNNKTEDEVYNMWREYVSKCNAFDQSPVKSEFVQWYKLQSTEALLLAI